MKSGYVGDKETEVERAQVRIHYTTDSSLDFVKNLDIDSRCIKLDISVIIACADEQ